MSKKKHKQQVKKKTSNLKAQSSNLNLLAQKLTDIKKNENQSTKKKIKSKSDELQVTNYENISLKNEARSAKYENVQGWVTYFIFLQALIAMLGSLYYSTFGDPVANFQAGNLFPVNSGLIPCELCWFARILMYPIVFISAVGIIKNDRRFTNYVLPLAIPGIALEVFHYSLQKFSVANPFGCTLANPCDAIDVQYLGFITIPFLCLIAFIVITLLSLANVWLNKKLDKKNEE